MKITLHVPDMTCGGCANAITRAIQRVDPEASVDADPPSHRLEVNTRLEDAALRALLSEAGYPPA